MPRRSDSSTKRHVPARTWSKGSSTSSSTSSTRSQESAHTQNTNITAFSDYKNTLDQKDITKQHVRCEEVELFDEPYSYIDKETIDPRASTGTYASTVASERKSTSSKSSSLYPSLRHTCYEPDTLATTPTEFGNLFPSARRLLIQHDDTVPDGNMNLRLDTEVHVGKGQRIKMTLFHLRMYDLAERQFSLRRYERQSGREVCNSKRKYLKPLPKPSPPSRRRSLTNSLKSLRISNRQRSRVSYDADDSESDDDLQSLAAQADVEATIPTNITRIEFSNYAQVELQRCGRSQVRAYDFEYWGQTYSWRKNICHDEDTNEVVFSFDLVNKAAGTCLAHIIPDRLSALEARLEASQGSWVPPCSMRIVDKSVSSDLGDVIVATGMIALADDCIKHHWREPHRH